ncbi:MAG: 2-oxoacid:acceptor oxidoreductase family protein, partial [Bacteroidales bacterium]|nr:2-oxoacid:acceptor oxidoreductase family protein [Bacteroidales bacterium]
FNGYPGAKELGSARSGNMVILGAAARHLGLPFEEFEKAIRAIFGAKGDAVVESNLTALRKGAELGK